MRVSEAVRTGWVPAALLAVAAAAGVLAYQTPPEAVAAFALYVALGLAVPGMLWVRWARGPGHLAEDLALGLVTGYAIEIAAYLVARAIGLPLLVLVWPGVTLGAFLLLPSLRRHWHAASVRAPLGWSWALAALLMFIVWTSAATFFARHPLSGTYVPYVDMPYHLALIAELRWHVPPEVPYVAGLPLAYHWFFYAEAAATSWATGVDPVTLLYRLSVLPMLVAFVLLTAAAARRITGAWWSGPVAAAIAVLGTVATPYATVSGSVFDAQTLQATWISPTNAFGLAMFGGLLLVVVDIVSASGPLARRKLALACVLVLGASGAKATLLPLLIAGLLALVVVHGIRTRGAHRPALALLLISGIGAAAALVLVYRGTGGGLEVGLQSLRLMPVARWVGAVTAHGTAAVVLPLVALALALVLWSFLWAGALPLLARPVRTAATPALVLLAGVCVAALAALVAFRYPGLSQLYYARSAAGAFAVLSVAGIASLRPERVAPRTLAVAVAIGAGAGALVVVIVTSAGHGLLRPLSEGSLTRVVLGMLAPVGLLLAAVAAVAVAVRGWGARDPRVAAAAPLLVIAMAMGFSAPPVVRLLTAPLSAGPLAGAAISADGVSAARWLRDHSQPDDLVATNLHCLPVPNAGATCDARNFWVSAYAERRVLVEGWAYTTKAVTAALAAGNPDLVAVPFWDQQRLALNDRAFTAPDAAVVRDLRARYGVSWLFADTSTADAAALARVASLRFQSGNFAVYQLP